MVLKYLIHAANLVRHSLRDVGVSAERSNKWPTLEKHFLAEHPTCEACGGKERLNVHHIVPFHDDPSKELDPTNLITLCMGMKEHHLQIGHLGNFKLANPNVIADCAKMKKHPEKADQIIKEAKARKV